MKIGICAWVLPGEEIEAFKIASEIGLDGLVIDYGIHNQQETIDENPLFTKEGRQKYLDQAGKYNIEIPTIALNALCNKGMVSEDNMEYAKELISNAVDIAAEMGIAKLQIPSFYNNLVRTEQDMVNTIKMFKYACQKGEKKNILIGTENVFTIEQNKRLIEEVDSPQLIVLFDTQNPWRMANQDGVRIAEYLQPYTKELHAKDSIIGQTKTIQLGQGDVRFNESMAIFAKAGFDEWIHLESTYKGENYQESIKKDMTILHDIFGK